MQLSLLVKTTGQCLWYYKEMYVVLANSQVCPPKPYSRNLEGDDIKLVQCFHH